MKCVGAVLLLFIATCAAQGVITTIAGAEFVFPFLSGPALNAPMGQIWRVAADANGNVYIADLDNLRVFKYSPGSGTLSVFAGNGIGGRSGDDGPAVNASLAAPFGVAFDRQGNLYITDGNGVRKVTPAGIITTVPVTGAQFGILYDIAVDSVGNLYVADPPNRKVYRVAPDGTATLAAGNGNTGISGDGGPATSASLAGDFAVAVDSRDDLYIVTDGRVRKVPRATGIITTVAGGGTGYTEGAQATSVSLPAPSDVTFDAAGNMLIACPDIIFRVAPDGTIRIIANGGSGTLIDNVPALGQAGLTTVLGITTDASGNVYVADGTTNRLRRFTPGSTIATVAGNGSFRFSGDGGPATTASFRWVHGLARGQEGSIYVSDLANNRVRRIAPNRIITTIAGTGIPGFSGDGGAAVNAQFFFPSDLGVDDAGNLYVADFNNGRIRKITPAGLITTIAGGGSQPFVDGTPATSVPIDGQIGAMSLDAAGNIYVLTRSAWIYKVTVAGTISRIAGTGVAGFSGDGGPATAARIGEDFYGGIAVDAAGNVFFSDHQNHRVRRIDTNGIITTVAGDGTAASSGDGGPPGAAGVHFPTSVRFDAGGNLLIAEGCRVRRVAGGIISTIAGSGNCGTSGDGGPSTQADLQKVWEILVEPDGSILIGDDSRRIRRVQASVPTLSAGPASLSFSGTAGGAAPETQAITISSSTTSLAWTATAVSTGNWLSLSAAKGTTPGSTNALVNLANLAAGTYPGSIAISAPGAAPAQVTIAVTLRVAAAQPARLAVDPATLTFQTISGSNPAGQTVQVRNAGGGTLNWTALADDGGRGWLSISRASGAATPSLPSAIQVLVAATGLSAGAYNGTVVFTGASNSDIVALPVSLIVNAVQRSLLLSQTGLSFSAVQGDGVVPSQTFGVLNVGQGSMNWTARIQSATGCGWLAVSPGSGSSVAGAADVPLVEVQVDASRIDAGQYSCQISVEAPDATASPRLVTVFLTVLPPGSTAPAVVRPTGLIFVRRAGTSSPGSQTSTLATSAPAGVDTRITASTFDPANWLRTAENSLLVSPTRSGRITVQPDLGSLAPGQYFGTVDLKFRDQASGRFTSQAIEVLFVVTPAGSVAAPSVFGGPVQNGCVPARLFPKLRTLGTNTTAAIGYPTTIEVQVRDDCDNTVTSAAVIASFSSGDAPLALVQVGNGVYTGSWRPIRAASTSIRVTAQAGSLTGVDTGNVQVASVGLTPAISPGGIVNGASFAKGGLAPGGIISVFGLGLAGSTAGASAVPLPNALAGSSLIIGGVSSPLYYASEGQVNAQVPFELQPGTPQAYLQINRQGTPFLTDAETITVVPARPGVFAVGAPDGQGAVTDPSGRLVDGNFRAGAGDVVVIYASGLGAVDRPVKTGEASPGNPVANTRTPVTVTVGGRSAAVQFAGLTPGFVGLYQINVQIPSGVAPGPAVPLTVIQDGVTSNTVTIGVR